MSNSILGGRYQIISHLGGGGFGQTYLAEDLHLPGKPYCVVKKLNPQWQTTSFGQEAKRLFDREAQVLYNLDSDNLATVFRSSEIPRLLACFEEAGEFYLVQEFIEGKDLKQELESIPHLSEDRVIDLLYDILDALISIHHKNIVHRDIKPANIIKRQSDSKFILIDFGAATEINAKTTNYPHHRSLTIPICTPGYTPEEQLRGKPCFGSDIYALGMTAIQSLTGLHPVDIPEDSQQRKLIWRDKIQVNPSLANILDKMVASDSRKRYQSAQDVLNELNQLNLSNKKSIELAHNISSSIIRYLPKLQLQFTKNIVAILVIFILFIASYFISQSCLNKFSHQKFCQVSNVPDGLFNYGGSSVWVSIRKEIDSVIQKELPNFRLRYTPPDYNAPSSRTGIQMLLDNQIDFAQSAVLINEEEYQLAKERGIRLEQIPIGIDAPAIAVHPSLNIPGLTIEQFHKIYTGKITNWNQIGGPNLEIIPYGKIGRDIGNHIILLATTNEAFRKVANNPGGIYYTSATLVLSQCTVKPLPVGINLERLIPPYKQPFVEQNQCLQKHNQVNMPAFESGQYPLSRRLSVAIKKNSKRQQKAGEAYANLLLTNQGQDLIEKVGFLRIR
ncbi:MAG TPA: hypothetical protein DEA78_24760 [Cyanobacteria bacterium UBA11159]|nr:hypothetical protein [Cyanobacteria bacterium UBA11367]HBK64450.1 hypothetical protein [Cyanobacteria bacterium UBA11166]HBR76806.1 hypothetical protein [Cyanobacteria bacterium UBA11159]